MEFQFKQKELLIFLRKLETEDAELMEFPDLVLKLLCFSFCWNATSFLYDWILKVNCKVKFSLKKKKKSSENTSDSK